MDANQARRLAVLAGNGVILSFLANYLYDQPNRSLDLLAKYGTFALVPLIGVVLAYTSLLFPLSSKRAAILEIGAALAFLVLPVIWVGLGLAISFR